MRWQIPDNFLNLEGYCVNQSMVEAMAATMEDEPGQVAKYDVKQKQQAAPLGFSLSSLQKKASSRLGFTAKQVLDVAQSLYEKHKAISYPRTDCGYLPTEQFNEAGAILNNLVTIDPSLQTLIKLTDSHLQSPIWHDKKITAHHAIIPTNNNKVDITTLTEPEFLLYDLIRRQYIAQFLGEYVYEQQTFDIVCANEHFTASCTKPLAWGWKQALQDNLSADTENVLPTLNVGQLLQCEETKVETKQTKAPAHYTEGSLIDAMKHVGKTVEDDALQKVLKTHSGIGTEATRANILETLFKRGFLVRQNKQVLSTPKGQALIEVAPALLKNPVLTAQWEQQLAQLSDNGGDVDKFIDEQVTLLHEMLAQLQQETEQHRASILQLQSETQTGKVYLCPTCEAPLRRLKNKKQRYFWGCSRYPDCQFTTWERGGKPHV